MRFISGVHTDVGTVKKINQDAFSLKVAKTQKHSIAFSVLCDGMGGLKNGEIASATVVNYFSNWFENEFAEDAVKDVIDFNKVCTDWRNLTLTLGSKIMNYGNQRSISLGTTLVALLIIDDAYIIENVGDSRIYVINNSVRQITKDQTLVAHEVETKKITPEEALTDSRKNILLQCVGASKIIEPEFQSGRVMNGDVFLLCSDGFRHKISEEEMYGVLAPALLTDENTIKQNLIGLVELDKSRGEQDNITAVAVKALFG